MPNQADSERETFEAFALVAPFRVIQGTIESRRPPEPDIVCEIEGRGRVGFELTELIDEDYKARVNTMFKTKQHLSTYWRNELKAPVRQLFEFKYGDASICVTYQEGANYRRRKRATPSLIQTLLSLPDNFSGEVQSSNNTMDDIIGRVYIDRPGIAGPIVDVDSYGRLGDPTQFAIERKLRKTYMCDYPIELLAHIDINLLPLGIWENAAAKAAEGLNESPFKRLWVFDRTDQSIKYEAKK
jgi:hypothetical protein